MAVLISAFSLTLGTGLLNETTAIEAQLSVKAFLRGASSILRLIWLEFGAIGAVAIRRRLGIFGRMISTMYHH
jgi:hypothetical protein